jgi:hypothetical protein
VREGRIRRLIINMSQFIDLILFPAVGSWQNRRIRANAMG